MPPRWWHSARVDLAAVGQSHPRRHRSFAAVTEPTRSKEGGTRRKEGSWQKCRTNAARQTDIHSADQLSECSPVRSVSARAWSAAEDAMVPLNTAADRTGRKADRMDGRTVKTLLCGCDNSADREHISYDIGLQ